MTRRVRKLTFSHDPIDWARVKSSLSQVVKDESLQSSQPQIKKCFSTCCAAKLQELIRSKKERKMRFSGAADKLKNLLIFMLRINTKLSICAPPLSIEILVVVELPR